MSDSSTITDQTPKEKPVVITSSGSKKDMFKFSFVNPKILGAMTVLLLLIGGVAGGVYMTQNRQQTTSQASPVTGVDLSFKPADTTTSTGSQFNVDIFAAGNDNQINSTDLTITYDPEVLTLKSISPGQFLPKILIPPKIEPGQASISLGTDGNSGVSGSGVIASLLLKVNDQAPPTTTQISLEESTKIKVLNRTNEGISDTLGSAQVTIIQAIPPSPSPPKLQENTDLNGDGVINGIDRLLYLQKSRQ